MERQNALAGFTAVEMVIVLSLLASILVCLLGLHMITLSVAATSEASSIAANLARARMEELLALPRETLEDQNGTEIRRRVPYGRGPEYLVHTSVIRPDSNRLELLVTVSWSLSAGTVCTATAGDNCAGSVAAYFRTLETQVQAPVQP